MRVFILLLLLLLATPTVLAGFREDYYASPLIRRGSYASYRVYYHPSVEEACITVLEAGNDSIVIELAVVDMARAVSKTILVYNISAGQFLHLGDDRWMPYPFVSPGLGKRDFLNLAERQVSGLTVQRVGGEVWNYSFRKVFYYEDPYTYYAWDGESGVLLTYQRTLYPPLYMVLQSTNLWDSPFSQLPHPGAVAASIVGVMFTHWEVWLAALSLIILRLAWGWLAGFMRSVRDVRANSEMERMMRLINDQHRRVKIIK